MSPADAVRAAAPLRPAHVSPVSLAAACAGLTHEPVPDVMVTGISLDSRTITAGELYVALPGAHVHGAEFAPDAAARGAAGALTDEAGARSCRDAGLATVVVDSPRPAMAVAASRIFPQGDLPLIGITGTNGKTTTSFLVEAGLESAGHTVGTIGTIGFRLGGRPLAETSRTTVTTPEAPDLHALLAVFRERGADSAVMEVSSHSLALHRVDGARFEVGAFINLGRDHLDFHHTMEAYFEAKARLFEPGRCRSAVVNIDDEHGRILAARIRDTGAARLVTTGRDPRADYRILDHRPLAARAGEPGPAPAASVLAATPAGRVGFDLLLPGEYNAANAVMALAILMTLGLPAEEVVPGLWRATVPGRMQLVDLPGRGAPRVFVDFAHTPQAIDAALGALPPGRVVVVVGAGGDRDTAKRELMGQAAGRGGSFVVVTDDNPRTEDPAAIRAQVLAGVAETGTPAVEIGDRRAAIAAALAEAGPEGIVAVLGKGHEHGQEIAGRVVPYDDVSAVREAWGEGQHE